MKSPISVLALAGLALALNILDAGAGEVRIVGAEATAQGSGLYRFDVTLSHGDTGWDHYADAWEVLAPGGEVLGKRVLLHPHVDEQPFTRSLSGVRIPPGITSVAIRAHDKVHGEGPALFTLDLPGR